MKPKPIVLATDGSPSASEATLHAIELARTLGAPLVAVSVEHVTTASFGYFGYAEILGQLEKIARDQAEDTLARTSAVAAEAGIECDAVRATGLVAEQICRIANKRGAQMIVIGAHGWGSMNRAFHGSVSTAVVHDAPCPVLVVRGGLDAVIDPTAVREEATAT